MINIAILIIAFVLDSIVKNSVFTLMTIPFLYLSFFRPQKEYYIIAFLIGLLYDLIYTDTIILNAGLFLLIAFLIKKYYDKVDINPLSIFAFNIALIFFYHIATYFLLIIIGYKTFQIYSLYMGLKLALIPNTIFTFIIMIPYTLEFLYHFYDYRLYNKDKRRIKKKAIILLLIFLISFLMFWLLFKTI